MTSDRQTDAGPLPAGRSLEIDADLARRMIVPFLADSLQRHGFTRAIIGMSGGLDSSVTAALAVHAFGPDNVVGVALPYAGSSPQSEQYARRVAEQTGIRFETVSITPMAEPYLASIDTAERVRRGNVLARLRMIVLYDVSAREAGLVVGTSNKTELLLGYSTQFGDSACAVMPIGDLYKTQVRQLARHLEVPDEILAAPASADLWAGQTDEEELGFTYDAVDRLLARMVDDRLDTDRLLEEGFDPALISRVRQMIRRTEYKRHLPPVAKLSARTVGIDFRYPRDWDAWGRD